MKLTILREDGAVYKDGVSFSNLNLSFIPSTVHALQFNDTVNKGWIEFVDNDFGEKPANELITDLPVWAVTALTEWENEKAAQEAALLAAQEAALLAAQEAANNQSPTTGIQAA